MVSSQPPSYFHIPSANRTVAETVEVVAGRILIDIDQDSQPVGFVFLSTPTIDDLFQLLAVLFDTPPP